MENLKRYDSAMVIGKFMPLHKGHKRLIDFARCCAHTTTVLVLGHKNEYIPLALRKKWMDEEYKGVPQMFIYGIDYDENELNSSSESDLKSSIEWADYLMYYIKLHGIDVIIGSEKYVQYMAEYLGIDYIIYDEERKHINISATEIKRDVIKNWDYLAPSSKRYFAQHVCICGTESTGKTTVCREMEDKYEYVTMIPEIGRCLVGNAATCTENTLRNVFEIHRDLLKRVLFDPPTPIVIWDTDNITTLSYYAFLFKQKMYVYDVPLANKYFFFEPTIPYQKDVTRLDQGVALDLRDSHLNMYKEFDISPTIIDRLRKETVENYIKETMTEISKKISGNEKLV